MIESLERRELLSTFTVTSPDDSGPGTLRQAIVDANGQGGQDRIEFNLPVDGSGMFQGAISIDSPLPAILTPLVIDGFSQPGTSPNPNSSTFDDALYVKIDGTMAGASANGLEIDDKGSGTTIQGLDLANFSGSAIAIEAGASGNVVAGCRLETSGDTLNLGDTQGDLLLIAGGSDNTIGGTTPQSRNAFYGRRALVDTSASYSLIRIGTGAGPFASHNVVEGNLIAGNRDLDTLSSSDPVFDGVYLGPGSSDNSIGGAADGAANLIVDNPGNGIRIYQSDRNVISCNDLGFIPTSTYSVPVQASGNNGGITILGANDNQVGTIDAGNVISGNVRDGLYIGQNANRTLAQNNHIGVDENDTPAPNGWDGVRLVSAFDSTIGGATRATWNRVSGNSETGIDITGGSARNIVSGNYVGTDTLGRIAIPNGNFGVYLESATTNNTVGGSGAAPQNLISGNAYSGIRIIGSTTPGNVIEGNYVGVDFLGNFAIGNQGNGIEMLDAVGTVVRQNVISGNVNGGLALARSTQTRVEGNLIGTDWSGKKLVGNQSHGILIVDGSTDNIIGTVLATARNFVATTSQTPGEILGVANQIAGNGRTGIWIQSETSTGNVVLGNFIHDNVSDGVQIDGASGTRIGDLDPVNGNTITGNGGDGVHIVSGVENPIFGNTILNNSGLGIALDDPNVPLANDPDDGDDGPNHLQNTPVLTSFSAQTVSPDRLPAGAPRVGSVVGSLDSTPNTTYRIQFFGESNPIDGGGSVLDTEVVTTDATGHTSFVFLRNEFAGAANFLTATATDPNGNTSEFSAPVANAPPQNDQSIHVDASADHVALGDQVRYTVTDTNQGPDYSSAATVQVLIPDGMTVLSVNGAYQSPSPGVLTFAPGSLAPGESRVFSILVQAGRSGQFNVPAQLIDAHDLDPTNDQAFRSLTVDPPVTLTQAVGVEPSHGSTSLLLTFSGPLDSGPPQIAANYTVTASGRNVRIPVASATYNASSHTVTLQLARRLPPQFLTRLVVGGDPPQALTDASGHPIDGNNDGRPGGLASLLVKIPKP